MGTAGGSIKTAGRFLPSLLQLFYCEANGKNLCHI